MAIDLWRSSWRWTHCKSTNLIELAKVLKQSFTFLDSAYSSFKDYQNCLILIDLECLLYLKKGFDHFLHNWCVPYYIALKKFSVQVVWAFICVILSTKFWLTLHSPLLFNYQYISKTIVVIWVLCWLLSLLAWGCAVLI